MHEDIIEHISYDKGYQDAIYKYMNKLNWIEIEDEAPKKGKRLLYFHDMTGVSLGFYFGIDDEYCSETGHVFGGQFGFLTGDASHWCYIPDYPEGFEDMHIADAEWAREVEEEINQIKKPIGGEGESMD
jgi:hypothetical protein